MLTAAGKIYQFEVGLQLLIKERQQQRLSSQYLSWEMSTELSRPTFLCVAVECYLEEKEFRVAMLAVVAERVAQ